MTETVKEIPLDELHPFPDRPFGVRDDDAMQQTVERIKEYGALVPAIARTREDSGYEIIAGHRRKHACELAGMKTMPVIVRDLDRNAATIIIFIPDVSPLPAPQVSVNTKRRSRGLAPN